MGKGIARGPAFSAQLGPCEVFDLVLNQVLTGSERSDQSALWLAHLLPKLGRFLETACVIQNVRSVVSRDVAAWVDAPLPDGRSPSLATRHNRRSAAAAGFRILRDLGAVDHDPTLDLALPARTWCRETRPLTDEEIDAGRAASLRTVSETRLPAVWALAETTATTHEIPRVRARHIDLDAGTVALSGSSKTEPRTSHLTDWGVRVLGSRLATHRSDTGSMTYEGRGSVRSMQASSSMAIARVLRRAGLRRDPAVKPESVRAWAGRRVWTDTGRIESAAIALGCGSLDTAAGVIGYPWADPT